MELKDLMVLEFSGNALYISAVEVKKAQKNPGLKIDLEKGTWSYEKIGETPIGEKANTPYRNGPIGIYDITNIEHIKKMVSIASHLTADRHSYDYL